MDMRIQILKCSQKDRDHDRTNLKLLIITEAKEEYRILINEIGFNFIGEI